MKFDTIVVGAGLAGASAALQLSQHQNVLLIEANHPAAGASGVAGSLFSPMIALRGRPVWKIDEAIDAFHEQLALADATELFDGRGVLRPAKDDQQVVFFKKSVAMCPAHAVWLPTEVVSEKYPKIHAPLGALYAKTGGAISTADYSQRMVDASIKCGATYLGNANVVHWGEAQGSGFVDVIRDSNRDNNRDSSGENNGAAERHFANRVVLALGRNFVYNSNLDHLDLHAVKGQAIRISKPPSLHFEDFPPLSGLVYIIPKPDTLAIGSSFEHTFEDERASSTVSLTLLDKAAKLLPPLAGATILEEQAGIRVTVPKIRLPMMGLLPGSSHIWVFTAFGSKGLLLTPLLASRLHKFFTQPDLIYEETQVRVKS